VDEQPPVFDYWLTSLAQVFAPAAEWVAGPELRLCRATLGLVQQRGQLLLSLEVDTLMRW